jgi:hypothetical protein
MMKALIWKEWCEQRWKLAFGCVLIGGFTAVALRARIFPDEGVVMMAAVVGAMLMALFVSMDVFAREREEETLGTLLALPVRKWRAFAAKMVIGAVICAGPIVLATALILLMAGGREWSAREIMRYCSSGAWTGLSMYVWMTAFGVRQSTEARAGLVSIGVVVAWWLAAMFFVVFWRYSWMGWWVKAIMPFGFVRLEPSSGYAHAVKGGIVQLLVLGALVAWGLRRFDKDGREMKATAALMWKEWRQVRWFLFGGILIFFGVPMMEAVWSYRLGRGFKTNTPEGIVLGLGGVLAIFVAVGLTCQDLKRGVGYFWQSRPVRVWQWALNKYVMGLVIVLAICCNVLLMQWYMYKLRWPEHMMSGLYVVLYVHSFTIILLYSLAFLFGSLMRRAVYATIFSIAAGLLVYFLPVLVPALQEFSVLNLFEGSQVTITKLHGFGLRNSGVFHNSLFIRLPWTEESALQVSMYVVRYAVVCVGAGMLCCILAAAAVKRNWRLRVEQRLMYWSLGVVMLLLLCTFAFQVGTNLECVRRIQLRGPDDTISPQAEKCVVDGMQGVLLVQHRVPRSMDSYYSLRRFDLSCGESPVSKDIFIEEGYRWEWMAWSAERPDYVYFVRETSRDDPIDNEWERREVTLVTVALEGYQEGSMINELELVSYREIRQIGLGGGIYMDGKTLYVEVGGELFIMDMSNPAQPEVRKSIVESNPWHRPRSAFYDAKTKGYIDEREFRLLFPELESTEERIERTIELGWSWSMASEGDILVSTEGYALKTYRLKSLEQADIAIFEQTGRRAATPLEQLIEMRPRQLSLRDGFCYALYYDGLSVFDVRNPANIKRAGHYKAPEEWFSAMSLLPDGNVLLCGRSLHVVAPPKAARGN